MPGCTCYQRMKDLQSRLFQTYGQLVGRYPVPFIVAPIVVFGLLGLGLMSLEPFTDLEQVYFPVNSRAEQDRQLVRDAFPKGANNVSYNPFSQSDADQDVTLLFVVNREQHNVTYGIFGMAALAEMRDVVRDVKNLTVHVGGTNGAVSLDDVCARSNAQCVVEGEFLLSPSFESALAAGLVTFPYWQGQDLSRTLAGVTLYTNGTLVSAEVMRVIFHLADDGADSKLWQKRFLGYAASLDSRFTEASYEAPDSLSKELDKSTKGDIVFFSLTITVLCTYASVVSSGGNPVSTRAFLAYAGILAAGLGIVGSMGLLSLCGVKFVSIVGVVPFLIIGIGVDDMFLLMSSWSETLGDVTLKVPERVGRTLVGAGVGITITSLTDFLAFLIGSFSVFRSVTNFSLYAGVAVLFCYISQLTLFTGCLSLHARRVYASRHALTCMVTRPRAQLAQDGRSSCAALVCGGEPPDRTRMDESPMEKVPGLLLPRLFHRKAVSVVIVMLFLVYVAVAIYGTINLRQGLDLKNLVQDTSYLHRYLTLTDEHFPSRIPVAFVASGRAVDYSGVEGQQFLDLLQKAKTDPSVNDNFQRCWLTSYLNSTFYNSSVSLFVGNLNAYLNDSAGNEFQNDVVVRSSSFGGSGGSEVVASRCFVMTEPSSDQYANAETMKRMRAIADESPLPVFAYHSSFVAFEQLLAVLPATLQLVGIALAVMTVVTFLLLPHPLMVLLVLLTILMILVGIFGFMHFWGLTLSSITMIHLIMSVGFSVDFSAHVCTAYLMSDAESRQGRTVDAIRHAAAPIFNGAMSTFLGMLFLILSSSYIFQSFLKVMVLVIGFGFLHSVLFLPAMLSLIGPQHAGAAKGTVRDDEADKPNNAGNRNSHHHRQNQENEAIELEEGLVLPDEPQEASPETEQPKKTATNAKQATDSKQPETRKDHTPKNAKRATNSKRLSSEVATHSKQPETRKDHTPKNAKRATNSKRLSFEVEVEDVGGGGDGDGSDEFNGDDFKIPEANEELHVIYNNVG